MAKLHSLFQKMPRAARKQALIELLVRSKLIDPVQSMEFNGSSKVFVDLRDKEFRSLYLSPFFCPEYFPIFEALVAGEPSPVIFDVGSNFGLVTFGLLPTLPRGTQWHLFEANPNIIPALERSAALVPERTIVISNVAVTDARGTSRHALVSEMWGQGQVGGKVGLEVNNLVLDDYIEKRHLQHVSLMKMDIEGWEPKAIAGATRSLAAGKVSAGWIELHPVHLARCGSSPTMLLAQVAALGFDAFWCGLADYASASHVHQGIRQKGEGKEVVVNGTHLRVAPAVVHEEFLAGDALIVHRSSPLSAAFRAAAWN